MYTLGINAVYHDSAACLVKDGWVVAAAEEERFTRIKHGKRPIPFSTYELPFYAIDYCLREAGITPVEVDHIAYSYDPFLLLGRYRQDATIKLPLEPSAHPSGNLQGTLFFILHGQRTQAFRRGCTPSSSNTLSRGTGGWSLPVAFCPTSPGPRCQRLLPFPV